MVVTDFKRERQVLVDACGHVVKRGTFVTYGATPMRIIDARGPKAYVVYDDHDTPRVVLHPGSVTLVRKDGSRPTEARIDDVHPRLHFVPEADLAKAEGA